MLDRPIKPTDPKSWYCGNPWSDEKRNGFNKLSLMQREDLERALRARKYKLEKVGELTIFSSFFQQENWRLLVTSSNQFVQLKNLQFAPANKITVDEKIDIFSIFPGIEHLFFFYTPGFISGRHISLRSLWISLPKSNSCLDNLEGSIIADGVNTVYTCLFPNLEELNIRFTNGSRSEEVDKAFATLVAKHAGYDVFPNLKRLSIGIGSHIPELIKQLSSVDQLLSRLSAIYVLPGNWLRKTTENILLYWPSEYFDKLVISQNQFQLDDPNLEDLRQRGVAICKLTS